MIRTTKALFARHAQTWADCPDWVQAIILDKISGTIRTKMEQEQSVRQDRCEGYTDDWAVVAAELQSQASSWTTQQPAHQRQTPAVPELWEPPSCRVNHPARLCNGQHTEFNL